MGTSFGSSESPAVFVKRFGARVQSPLRSACCGRLVWEARDEGKKSSAKPIIPSPDTQRNGCSNRRHRLWPLAQKVVGSWARRMRQKGTKGWGGSVCGVCVCVYGVHWVMSCCLRSVWSSPARSCLKKEEIVWVFGPVVYCNPINRLPPPQSYTGTAKFISHLVHVKIWNLTDTPDEGNPGPQELRVEWERVSPPYTPSQKSL